MFFFSAYDCSEETPLVEKFVFKFGNTVNAEKFKKPLTTIQSELQRAEDGSEIMAKNHILVW